MQKMTMRALSVLAVSILVLGAATQVQAATDKTAKALALAEKLAQPVLDAGGSAEYMVMGEGDDFLYIKVYLFKSDGSPACHSIYSRWVSGRSMFNMIQVGSFNDFYFKSRFTSIKVNYALTDDQHVKYRTRVRL